MSTMFGERKERRDNDKEDMDNAHKMAKNLMDTFDREYGNNVSKGSISGSSAWTLIL